MARETVALLYRLGAGFGFGGPEVGMIQLDAILREGHQADAEVTEHPVESEADVADHIIPKVRTLDLVGAVSDHPIIPAGSAAEDWIKEEEGRLKRWETQRRLASLGGPLALLVPPRGEIRPPRMPNLFEGRSAEAWQELERLRRERVPVRVVTPLGTYGRMAITSISTERTARASTSLDIRISLVEVVTVQAERAKIPDELLKPVDQGKQVPTPAPPAVEERAKVEAEKSLLLHLGTVGGVFR